MSLRDSKARGRWVFLAFWSWLRVISQKLSPHDARKPQKVAPYTSSGQQRKRVGWTQGSDSKADVNYDFPRAAFQPPSPITLPAGASVPSAPVNEPSQKLDDRLLFWWWGSGKLRASGGLLGSTHLSRSPFLQPPFVKTWVSRQLRSILNQAEGQELPCLPFPLQMTSQGPGSELTKWTG